MIGSSPSATLPPALGPYTPVRKLGAGAHGAVYLAHGPTGRVALKLSASRAARERALREVELGRDLAHPCLVPVLDSEPAGEWLALEYVEGIRADRWCRGRPLGEVVSMLAQLCEGVACLHDHGIVHGDLKPANVLVDERGQPRLIDLGVAVRTGEAVPGGFNGTLGYAAPELLRGEAPAPAGDLYAIGVLAYEVITGRRPIRSQDPAALAWLPLKTLPEPPSSVRPELPQALDDLLLRVLARDPVGRPPNATALAAELRASATGDPGKPVVGMHREREVLRRSVVEVADGGSVVVIVHGPDGSGRSTLIREALAAARREGLAVVPSTARGPGGLVPRPWKALVEELSARRSAIWLEAEHPSTEPTLARILSGRIGALALVRSSAPVPHLLALGARHLSPPPLSIEEITTLLGAFGADISAAADILRACCGRPGAIRGLLTRRALPEDLDTRQHELLAATSQGPVPVRKLAAMLGMGEHALLDLAEPLLDRGLLVERDDGRALERGR